MLDAQVYESLRAKVGARGIGVYLSNLARPHVVEADLEAGYKAMAADTEYNRAANEWIEGVLETPTDGSDWSPDTPKVWLHNVGKFGGLILDQVLDQRSKKQDRQ